MSSSAGPAPAQAPSSLSALRAAVRGGLTLDPGEVLFNNAGIAPMGTAAEQAIARAAGALGRGFFSIDGLFGDYERARATFARLVGVAPADLGFFGTCAAAISQVALGLPLAPGDEILLWDQEYPSNAYPWHAAAARSGAVVRTVPSEPDLSVRDERLHQAIGPRTRVVAVSWVQYQTGAVTELRALSERCRAVGAWLVVDAIQGLGVMPFDLAALGVDAVCGGTHKWLCGPLGLGFLGLAPGRAAELAPLLHGAMTYGDPDTPVDARRPPRPDARRFEPGSPPLLSALGGAAAVAWLLGLGIDALGQAALALADELREALLARGHRVLAPQNAPGAPRSPIVTFLPGPGPGPVPPEATRALAQRLHRNKVACAVRAGGIRLSPHAFNDASDLAALLRVLDRKEPGE